MAAGVLEDADVTVPAPDRDKWQAEEVDGDGIARLGQARGDGEPGPAAEEERVAFKPVNLVRNVVRVRQTLSL